MLETWSLSLTKIADFKVDLNPVLCLEIQTSPAAQYFEESLPYVSKY